LIPIQHHPSVLTALLEEHAVVKGVLGTLRERERETERAAFRRGIRLSSINTTSRKQLSKIITCCSVVKADTSAGAALRGAAHRERLVLGSLSAGVTRSACSGMREQ
jgi:hypothetical protein